MQWRSARHRSSLPYSQSGYFCAQNPASAHQHHSTRFVVPYYPNCSRQCCCLLHCRRRRRSSASHSSAHPASPPFVAAVDRYPLLCDMRRATSCQSALGISKSAQGRTQCSFKFHPTNFSSIRFRPLPLLPFRCWSRRRLPRCGRIFQFFR